MLIFLRALTKARCRTDAVAQDSWSEEEKEEGEPMSKNHIGNRLRNEKLPVADQMKIFELLHSMRKVHELCTELNFPEILDLEAACTIIKACMERGPEEVKAKMLAASATC
jgi:hypothetical protein